MLLILFALVGAYVFLEYTKIKPSDNTICEGVYVDDINIGGMTKDSATQALEEYTDRMADRVLSVDVNGKKIETTLRELGFTCEANDFVNEALKLGREGNIFDQCACIKELRKKHKVFNMKFSYSDELLNKYIEKKCGKVCVKPKDSKITMKNGRLSYSESKTGVTIDTKTTIMNIKKAISENAEATLIEVGAVIKTKEPKYDKNLTKRCKDKIGTFSTSFNAGNVTRSKNVANAARLINGTVVYPGKTFSVHDTISPLSEKNGYYQAPSYNNGQVVDTIGGGVCQVATTLYNALLFSELEIVLRCPHSMQVAYVDPSRDAAMAGDYKDLRFKNNTDVPIYIQGGTYSGTVYFNIYGEETRPKDRKISFKSEVLEKMSPGPDKIVYDKTKPVTYQSVTQEAHEGCKAVLYKIVEQGGKKEKIQINSSTYQAAPKYITKGTIPVSSNKTANTSKKDEKKVNNKADNQMKKESSVADSKKEETNEASVEKNSEASATKAPAQQ